METIKLNVLTLDGKFVDILWQKYSKSWHRLITHRGDGPAIIFHDGRKQWFLNGREQLS